MVSKSIPVLDEADLKDGQMKEVDFESGKVLLSRLGDKIHATSAFCTHYGAPLANGVLTYEGRIVCPWHGACFKAGSGDIEDAPAPDALHSFKTYVEAGKIYVTADPEHTLKSNMARPPVLVGYNADYVNKGLVIVGGGSGAFYTVESLRQHGYKLPITILTEEKHLPIDRQVATKLSKTLTIDPSKLEWRNAAELKIKFNTVVRTGVKVSSIDFTEKKVLLEGNAKEMLSYETLVLASGGQAIALPSLAGSFANVSTFRTVDDARKVDAAAKEGSRLLIIGSSFIGMELAAAVSKRKLASVDVVSNEPVPFSHILGEEVGRGLMKYHESQGVRFHMDHTVEKLLPKEEEVFAGSAVLDNGETIPCDFVVFGIGVKPATEYLKNSNGGPFLEKDGSVKVDQYLRVPGVDGVYAIGDIATYPQAETGEHIRIEHWNVAGNHGRAIGKTISGNPEPFAKVPIFWSAQGQQLRYCGLGKDYDDVIIKGDPGEMKFIAYYVKGPQVVAVASMQNDPVVTKSSELMRLGMMPSADELRAGKDVLSIDISTAR
ncbi:FAD/NAD(P)-binding domain-containing protein [Fistulina hepatica ATCC 64428]|nr:FAD/NAD(P)-binding domain-containing protein [Fistulina hepatica ATCC 64428]